MHNPAAGHVRLGDSRSIGSACCWNIIAAVARMVERTFIPATTAVASSIVSILASTTTVVVAAQAVAAYTLTIGVTVTTTLIYHAFILAL